MISTLLCRVQFLTCKFIAMKPKTIIIQSILIIGFILFEIWFGLIYMFPFLIGFSSEHGDFAAHLVGFFTFICRILIYILIFATVTWYLEIKKRKA